MSRRVISWNKFTCCPSTLRRVYNILNYQYQKYLPLKYSKPCKNRSHGSIYGCFVDVASYSAFQGPHVSGKKKMWGLHPFFPLFSFLFSPLSSLLQRAWEVIVAGRSSLAAALLLLRPPPPLLPPPSPVACSASPACFTRRRPTKLLPPLPPARSCHPSCRRLKRRKKREKEKKEEIGTHIFFSLTCGSHNFLYYYFDDQDATSAKLDIHILLQDPNCTVL